MNIKERIKKIFQPRLKLLRGTRLTSFLFIAASVAIAAGILWAANMYYNIDTAEVVTEEIYRVTGVLRATAGAIVGGGASDNPTAGYNLEVVGSSRLATTTFATGTVELTAANQVLRFTGGVSGYYAEFKANTSATSGQAINYTLPAAKPTAENYVLTSDTSGVWTWQSVSGVGAGDIQAVGNVGTGAAFTGDDAGGSPGNTLWFEGATANDYEIALTAADPGADYTITLPAATGYVALGTSTANYVAYWTGTNTLAGEQYLATSRGGTGVNSSAWNGMLKVVGGTWATTTGTANYAAYWSDGNTVAAEQYLAVTRGGTGAGTFTQYGVIYGNGTSAIQVTPTGSTQQLFISGGGTSAPSWLSITDLLNAGTNITISATGTNEALIATVNNPVFSTSVTSPIFTSSATTTIQSAASYGIVLDPATGIITLGSSDYIQTASGYEIGKTGTQVLREMIPILGFDLPAQTATTSYVKVSRKIENYPFASALAGTTRYHKLVIRYTDDLPTASTTDWRVATTTGASYYDFTVAGCNNSALDSGKTVVTTTTIPTDGTAWWLDLKIPSAQSGKKIRVFQIFLAAYDQIQ